MPNPPTLKILIAAPVPPPDHSGIANWTRIICKELGPRPDVELIFVDTFARFPGAVKMSLLRRLFFGSVQAVRDTFRIYRRMKTDRPKLLHLCTSGGLATPKDIVVLRLARHLGVPSVIHYHMGRLPAMAARAGLAWKLTRWAMSLANVVITLDKRSEASVKAALANQAVVTLPNIVDLVEIDDIRRQGVCEQLPPAGWTKIVCVAHVIPTKGIRELVAACAKLLDRQVALDVIGFADPPFQEQLESLASSTGSSAWLRFHGGVDHDTVVRHLAAADLFVLPSYTEGAPYSVLEAMACGKATVSTPVGAVPDMLDLGGPQECGRCVPPRDVDALSTAMAELLDNPGLRAELGNRARKRAEQLFSGPVACGQLLDLWRSVGK
jgi:glycosyltransferase involved in cell wall biosynthesis